MKRRNRLIATLLVTAGLLIVAIFQLIPPDSKITKENFRRLRFGMSLEQVESILGGKGARSEELYVGSPSWQWVDGQKRILVYFPDRGPSGAVFGTFVDRRNRLLDEDGFREEDEDEPESSPGAVRRWVKEWTGW